tara:strand:+ start:47 stop:622 length:576 start_codon:yes stop_codon:yes gene_type:complete
MDVTLTDGVSSLRESFMLFADASGTLDLSSLTVLMQGLGKAVEEKDVRRLFAMTSRDERFSITKATAADSDELCASFEHFCEIMAQCGDAKCIPTSDDLLAAWNAFSTYDLCSGKFGHPTSMQHIEGEKLKQILLEVGQQLGEDEVEELVARISTEDGFVSKETFFSIFDGIFEPSGDSETMLSWQSEGSG